MSFAFSVCMLIFHFVCVVEICIISSIKLKRGNIDMYINEWYVFTYVYVNVCVIYPIIKFVILITAYFTY